MKKEDINVTYYKRSTLLIVWSIIELLFLVFLFLTSYLFLFSCSKIIPRGPPSFQLKIQSDSIFAKNTFQLIQQGLKFATYLSNDLNIYINKTIPETYLQRLDSSYDNNLYQFNVFGFCRRNEFANVKNCYNGEGINVVTSFIQDLGMQLGNLTSQSDPKTVSAKLVTLFYDIINHVCSKEKSEVCVLRTYNCVAKAVQYVGILTLVSLGIAILASLVELVCYCIRGVPMNRAALAN
ncbi:Spore membrane assembly protein 2 [Candida viswanathii]|uniref:Spore membrane assembly protein 2 n=1 Tax=Candida viswanathii TaxID=5486 RepID=A0A367XZJ3_9ASCO|nr:Spore membrane assembly protein 2 [Candida viswanathii]